MRIRKLRIFTVIFVVFVLLAAFGLALLRTYVFKPPAAEAVALGVVLSAGLISTEGLEKSLVPVAVVRLPVRHC